MKRNRILPGILFICVIAMISLNIIIRYFGSHLILSFLFYLISFTALILTIKLLLRTLREKVRSKK